jgi:3-isopropylmalate dehydrogenase
MKATIALLPGDGIGPEVCSEAVAYLRNSRRRCRPQFRIEAGRIGGIAIDRHGDPLPPATIALCERADAVLLGAVGGPKWSDPNAPFGRNRACSNCAPRSGYTPTCAR